MNIYVNKITGIDDSMIAMLANKNNLTHKKEEQIREIVSFNIDRNGVVDCLIEPEFETRMNLLMKSSSNDIQLLNFIDVSITIEDFNYYESLKENFNIVYSKNHKEKIYILKIKYPELKKIMEYCNKSDNDELKKTYNLIKKQISGMNEWLANNL